jgi:hypothetical protein
MMHDSAGVNNSDNHSGVQETNRHFHKTLPAIADGAAKFGKFGMGIAGFAELAGMLKRLRSSQSRIMVK